MPAYARYCDIHVTADTSYHFTSEIVDYCRYQVETKNQGGVGKKALIVLDYVDNWDKGALALLKQFPTGRVVFIGGGTMAKRIGDLWKARNPTSGKMIGVDAQSGAAGKFLPKFLPDTKIANLEKDEFKDFEGYVLRTVSGGFSLAKAGAGNDTPTIAFCSDHNLELLDDGIGYLAISVPMSEVTSGQANAGVGKMVRWLAAESSKIRVTCHGDGEGNLEMSRVNQHGTVNESMSSDCIAKWLHANGLTSAGNLKTISLNICMGAKYNTNPAVMKSGQYSPAESSAVDRLAKKLTALGVIGVKITGSNEVVDAKEKDNYTRTAISGLLAKNAQSFRQMSIPLGFAFDRGTYVLTVPAGWTISQKSIEGSRLCLIQAPSNWKITGKPSVRQTTQYDGTIKQVIIASADYTFTEPGTNNSISICGDGWIVDLATRQALAAEGWTFIDAQHMKFSGTGGASVLEANGQSLKILERLAKSKAKAVAYS